MTTTQTGVESEDRSFENTDDAADAILNRWLDAGTLSDDDGGAKPSKKALETEADDEDEDNESELEAEDEGDEESEADDDGDEDDSEEPTEASDDAVVKVTIDGETRNVPVKDLKRLYGQEASLTRKSQEVAQHRKAAEDEGARYTLAATALLKRAEDKFAPYANIDWLDLQKQLDAESFSLLRKEARDAYADVQYLKTEVSNVFQQTQEQRQAALQEEAKAAVEVLKKEIPDWSPQKYDAIRSYAVEQGIPADEINQVVSPIVLKLLHKAMQFDTASAKLATKKKVAAPKRVMKSKGKAATVMGKTSTDLELRKLKETGSAEDAASLFLARWAQDSDS